MTAAVLLPLVKAYCYQQSIPVSTSDDTLLTRLCTAAEAITVAKCNRNFEADADTTRQFDAPSALFGQEVDTRDFYDLTFDHDLCQITTITNGDGTLVTAGQYVTQPNNYTPWYGIHLKINAGIVWTFTDTPENAISIVGRWAYSVTPPDAIVQANVRLTAWLYRQKDTSKDNSADRPIMSPSGVVIMPSNLPNDYLALINNFIRKI